MAAPRTEPSAQLIAPGGWIAFNLKDDFLRATDRSGFARLIDHMISGNVLSVGATHRYCHRLATNGEALLYVALAGRKIEEVELPL